VTETFPSVSDTRKVWSLLPTTDSSIAIASGIKNTETIQGGFDSVYVDAPHSEAEDAYVDVEESSDTIIDDLDAAENEEETTVNDSETEEAEQSDTAAERTYSNKHIITSSKKSSSPKKYADEPLEFIDVEVIPVGFSEKNEVQKT
jgi:hypothetical protein